MVGWGSRTPNGDRGEANIIFYITARGGGADPTSRDPRWIRGRLFNRDENANRLGSCSWPWPWFESEKGDRMR